MGTDWNNTELLGSELADDARIERCEFSKIGGVHFIFNGMLEAGVSSTSKMDSLGKVRV